MKRYNLKEFELSQSYLFYWDKLEKANWFLEQILDTVEEPLDGRLMQKLLDDPVGDGGQWDMVRLLPCPSILYYTNGFTGGKLGRKVRSPSSAALS